MSRSQDGSEPEWDRYLSSHHAHVGLPDEHPLRSVEFEANFGAYLPAPPATVLEIGFGRGSALRTLRTRGYVDLHGWDISHDCVEAARAAGVPARLTHCDAVAELACCAEGAFDAILAKDLVEHLPRDRVLDFVRGIHRALGPGGVFLGRLPNMASPLSTFLRYDDFTHRLGFTESSLLQVFTLGGFSREDVEVRADVLPAGALLRRRLWGTLAAEAVVGPLVRGVLAAALWSQRKGPPRVGTLRLVVAARKQGARA